MPKGFQKGQVTGRPKGAKQKTPNKLKQLMSDYANEYFNNTNGLFFSRLAQLTAKEEIDFWLQIYKHNTPRTVDVTGGLDNQTTIIHKLQIGDEIIDITPEQTLLDNIIEEDEDE